MVPPITKPMQHQEAHLGFSDTCVILAMTTTFTGNHNKVTYHCISDMLQTCRYCKQQQLFMINKICTRVYFYNKSLYVYDSYVSVPYRRQDGGVRCISVV